MLHGIGMATNPMHYSCWNCRKLSIVKLAFSKLCYWDLYEQLVFFDFRFSRTMAVTGKFLAYKYCVQTSKKVASGLGHLVRYR